MPDFNKGDFTQQGVNGHVNATVRLNVKRLVNIDMTSNEEAEGCTITGTVKDLLNDKVYNIGSGGGGDDNIILPMTEVTWDGTGTGAQLPIDPVTSDLTANEQVIMRLNVIEEGEDPWEIVFLGTYNPNAGPTSERISGMVEGEPQVEIVLLHTTDRPNEPWYLNISSASQAMPGTYLIGICTDIPHKVV